VNAATLVPARWAEGVQAAGLMAAGGLLVWTVGRVL